MQKQKCHISVCQNGNDYVGLTVENGDICIKLPIGYKVLHTEYLWEDIDEELKNDIKRLMKLLAKKGKKEFEKTDDLVDIDIFSALNVINDYQSYGLYKQSELKRKINYKGRIHWHSTLSQPQIFLKHKVLYTNLVNEYMDYDCEKEIQNIQEQCLSYIANSIGFLFDFTYPYSYQKMNCGEMVKTLKKELRETNEDTKKEMLMHLLDFMENTKFEALKQEKIALKYKEFPYIFQNLVDCIGIKNRDEFNPKSVYCDWKSQEKYSNIRIDSSLPDTIVMDDIENPCKVYLFDAKYKEEGKLPNEYDIFKQIRYMTYLKGLLKKKLSNKKFKNVQFKNAFILPKNLEDKLLEIAPFYATTLDLKEKEKIYVVYVNTKYLIENAQNVIKQVMLELDNFKEC